MRRSFMLWLLLGSIVVALPRHAARAQPSAAPGPLRFRITLGPALAPQGASGRLFVLMSGSPQKQERLETGFVPGDTWLAAMEVRRLDPRHAFEFDPDPLAFPHPFSPVKP